MTALHAASNAGHLPVCRLLLKRGADKHAKDKWKKTPLSVAHPSVYDRELHAFCQASPTFPSYGRGVVTQKITVCVFPLADLRALIRSEL